MQIQSHIIISKIVNESLRDQNIFLDYSKFRFGNIKPDLSGLLFYHSHRINQSFNYVVNIMNKLLVLDMDDDLSSFSLNLGVVCHYLTDFFTFPHNEHYQEGLVKHLQYERDLHKEIVELLASMSNKDSFSLFAPPHNIYSLSDLLEYIMELHEIYMQPSISTPQRDFSFATFICCIASQHIVALNTQSLNFYNTMHAVSKL